MGFFNVRLLYSHLNKLFSYGYCYAMDTQTFICPFT